MTMIIKRLYDRFFPSVYSIKVRDWKKSGGEARRYEYYLNENSVVVDLGGYEGEWASNLFSMYAPTVYVFEPIKSFFTKIEKRFSKNQKIHVYQYGLSGKNTEVELSVDANESSQFKNGTLTERVRLVKATDFFKQNGIEHIDLMKMNIEGGEYDLLEHLIETGYIKKIKDIQIQFHDFFPSARERMNKIQNDLSKTHHTTYQSEFIWENWELN